MKIEGISERFLAVRTHFGMSQQGIADHIGCHKNKWQNYENGKTIPGGLFLNDLRKLGISLDWLLSGDGEMLATGEPGFGLGEFDEDLFISTVIEMDSYMRQNRIKPHKIGAGKRARAYIASYKAVMRDHKNRAEWTGDGEAPMDEEIFKDIVALLD
jgi:transcriptional regulator with XRE-family HTH domain